jgi:signal transduction histidine kinase
MNYLYLLNAGFLLWLGLFLISKQQDRQRVYLLFFNAGLAAWNVSIFFKEALPDMVDVDLVSRLQLIFVMVFVNGMLLFCSAYPVLHASHRRVTVPALVTFSGLSLALIFTDGISRAEMVEGVIRYQDHPLGFAFYGIYLLALVVAMLTYLYLAHRKFPDYRTRVLHLFTGMGIFAVTALLFNVVLPILGDYRFLDLGRLSGTLPALVFAYVITKHEFMDVTVIINKRNAWLLTLGMIAVSIGTVYELTASLAMWQLVAVIIMGMLWGLAAGPAHNFLLTTARRKFVRSWYEPEDVLASLSARITAEKNRLAIFRTVDKVLDEVFQIEKSRLVLAMRGEDNKLSHYVISDSKARFSPVGQQGLETLIEQCQGSAKPRYLEDCDEPCRLYLRSLGFNSGRQCVLLPMHSPEHLEGIIILGEKSSQEPYLARDMKFFQSLLNYMSAILYRLTPIESLEKLYFENRQRLHEAEIQLIRAQKIESIVHATRQCHHEIRTPLNIIQLGIGRIKNIEDLQAYKKIAMEEISRALEIVEETLTITDVSKASDDRFSTFDVNEVLRRCARLVDESRYALRLELEQMPQFDGIFSDIQVAVTNLVHNAMDAMPAGGTLIMRSRRLGNELVIEIEDSGIGIPENLRSRVWEPYFSGHETEVGNSTAGRGWGLTIVNRIITEHHGRVNFVSEVGEGTIFTIILPLPAISHVEDSEQDLSKDKVDEGRSAA